MLKIILIVLIAQLLTLHAQSSQIYINEFLASNVSIDADIVDFDDYSDWIELYNAEEFAVDIKGYFLSDDLNNPYKWRFSESTVIPANGFLRVWADGYDCNPGRTFTRPYRDQNNDFIYFTTKYHHLNFSLSRAGERIALFAPDSSLVDSVVFALQLRDVSMGRKPDGSANWFFFAEPTAGDSNHTPGIVNIEYSDGPEITPQGGFYNGSQMVTLTASEPAAQIRYTLDGSKPTSASLLYESPLSIEQTTVLRARVFETGKLPGPVITQTYFIDDDFSNTVMSITSAPDVLFDNKIGIYDNTFKGREIPVHMELFDADGKSAFSLDAGLRLTGQLSIFYAQKSFTITARDRYGKDLINHQVFPERDINEFKDLYLRNAGLPDNQDTFFRDALAHALVLNKMDIDCQAYRPAVTFINGAYWGIYNIRDKINADYLATLHNLNPDDIDLLEYTGSINPEVMEGNNEDYLSFYDFISVNDLSAATHYDVVQNWMDIDEYINYQICEIFYDNVIWPDQNMRMWRERKEGKKWRWILFDIDYGLGMPNQQSIGYRNNTLRHATSSKPNNNPPQWSTRLLTKLLANSAFKTKFIQRFSSYLNGIFHPDTVLATLNGLQNNITNEMTRHINRWRNEDDYGTPIPNYFAWLDNVDNMKQFARNRTRYQRDHIIDYFELSGTTEITFVIPETQSGRIQINNTEIINKNATHIYFKDVPLILKAIPEVGYKFVKWSGVLDSTQNPLTFNPQVDLLAISAVFEPQSVSQIPSLLSENTTFTRANSPYYASANVTVDSNVTLQLDEGVQIFMPQDASIVVYGKIMIHGTTEDPVSIRPNAYAQNWGALCFVNATDSSVISNLEISGASKGVDFCRDKAAISGYNSRFALNNVTIKDSQAPVFVQYGKVSLINCYLTSDEAGDLINVKYAETARVENCELKGNDAYDSDAIDYDQIANGIIRGNRIYNFYGFNSDAVDLGEGSKNILIENNIIYNISDKGVSIGHGSTAEIKRNVFANCDMGIGIKDYNSFGYIEHNTFYGNNLGIAVYEKNIGEGGSNAHVVNSIIANSKTSSIFVDALSGIEISYSLSDTDELPGLYNTLAPPGFINNLNLAENSPAIDMGNPTFPADPDGSLPDLGAFPYDPAKQMNLIINEIHYNPLNGQDYEFIEIVNAGKEAVNLSGFQLAGDVQFSFPDETLSAGEYCIAAKNAASYSGLGFKVYQWQSGELPDGPGNILLLDDQSNLIDYVNYDSKYWWPREADGMGPSLELHNTALENKVSSSWRSSYKNGRTPGRSNNSEMLSGIYINEFLAANSRVNKDEYGEYDDWIEIYNSNSFPLNLGGLFISDNLQRRTKYAVPFNNPDKTTVAPGGFLLIWADGQPEQGPMHTNFKLDKEGEQIAIVQVVENDTLFIDSLTYAAQTTDISYGRSPNSSETWYTFTTPTPLDSNIITVIEEAELMPLHFALSQNYPNPFNPITTIEYHIPKTSKVVLSVYNILGQKVATLISQKQSAGSYKAEWNASEYASGIYYYRLDTVSFSKTKKLVLLK